MLGTSMQSAPVAIEMVILQLLDGECCSGFFYGVCTELSEASPCSGGCHAKKYEEAAGTTNSALLQRADGTCKVC